MMLKPFSPFPIFETNRLILRAIESNDNIDIFAMRSHPLMHQFTDSVPDFSLSQSSDYISRVQKGIIENRWLMWAIALKDSNKLIGTISIWNLDDLRNSGELGYGINPDFHHQGYMTEAIIPIINFGIEQMKLSILEAYTEIHNNHSIRLLENLGFQKDKVIVESGVNTQHDYQMAIYYISK